MSGENIHLGWKSEINICFSEHRSHNILNTTPNILTLIWLDHSNVFDLDTLFIRIFTEYKYISYNFVIKDVEKLMNVLIKTGKSYNQKSHWWSAMFMLLEFIVLLHFYRGILLHFCRGICMGILGCSCSVFFYTLQCNALSYNGC